MELFREAAVSFQAGRLSECQDRLLAVQLHGFSRLQWYLECNLLACRMRVLLRAGGGGCGLQGVLRSYERLWQRMTGISPRRDSVCAELSVVLAICQLLVILQHWSLIQPYIHTAVGRAGQVLSSVPGSPSDPPSLSLSHSVAALLDLLYCDSSVGEGAVKCVEKLSVLCALVEVKEEEEEEEGRVEEERVEGELGGRVTCSRAISAHSKWVSGESQYRHAWLQYCHGDYHKATLTLSSSCLASSPLTPLCELLCGACYAKQAKPALALLHWKRCMETGHTPGHAHFLSALQNCAMVYCESKNVTVAMATRRLEIEALKCAASSDDPVLPVWVWLDEKVGGVTTPTAHRSLAKATYCLAWKQLQMKNYRLGSEALSECVAAVQSGDIVPTTSFPSPSTLHLLRAYSVVCSGEGEAVRSGKVMCEELLHSSSPSTALLWRSEVMCILATASLHLGEIADSRKWSVQCVETVERAVGEVTDGSTISRLHLLQQHAQLLLVLTAIAQAQWREALQLLACVVATPTGLYNHCLLQCRVGVVVGGASGWVKGRRGRVPVGKSEARQWLGEARQQRSEHRMSGAEEEKFVAMDVAMLSLWLQHNR